MAFNGYLIKLGGSNGTVLPLKYMRFQTYNVTPQQRQDLDSTVDTSGYLHRHPVAHRRSKIEFNTPMMYNNDIENLMSMFRTAWTSDSERKLTLEYYDPEANNYKTGTFYMPDTEFNMTTIDTARNTILYNELRFAFIEY